MDKHIVRRRRQGQALVIIAGALVGLMAMVGLAVDGGNAYAQRRLAQNAVDGAANAGINTFNQIFQSNYNGETHSVNAISHDQSALIRQAVIASLHVNGADTVDIHATPTPGTFEVWYTDCSGNRYGSTEVGLGTGSVPFCGAGGSNSPGARGIWIRTTHSDRTYFATIIGVKRVSAAAQAGAEMGTTTGMRFNPASPPLWPITMFRDNAWVPGQSVVNTYAFSQSYAPGSWGVVDYTGTSGGNDYTVQWLQSGFNMDTETLRLAQSMSATLQTYTSYPISEAGIWQPSQSGNGISSNGAKQAISSAAATHRHIFMPISVATSGGGNGTRYKVVNIAEFEITGFNYPGNANKITGLFLGYTWDAAHATWSPDLSKALLNHQTMVRLSQ